MKDQFPSLAAAWLDLDAARTREVMRLVDETVAMKDRVVATINSVPAIRVPVAEDCDG